MTINDNPIVIVLMITIVIDNPFDFLPWLIILD